MLPPPRERAPTYPPRIRSHIDPNTTSVMFTDGSAPPGGPREIANSRFPAAGLAHLLEDQQFASVTLLRPSRRAGCSVPGGPHHARLGDIAARSSLAQFLDSPLSPLQR